MKKKRIKWEKLEKCLLCTSPKIGLFLNGVRYWENDISFKLFKCKDCDFVFVNPRPEQKYISNFYKSESYWGEDLNTNRVDVESREEKFSTIYNLIDFSNKSSIFDVGAGTGQFLSKFKELGWNVDGIEYSKDAVLFARKRYKLHLKSGDLLKAKLNKNEKFNYIVINNVLEHLYKPLDTLILLEKFLADEGKLILAVPNIDSLGFKIFIRNWYPLQPPIHLSQFEPKTIENILNRSGFKVIKIIHKNPIHAKFSLFESYRSLLTGRNKRSKRNSAKVNSINKQEIKYDSLIKKTAVWIGYVFSDFISYLGYVLKKGENIIIYAEKN